MFENDNLEENSRLTITEKIHILEFICGKKNPAQLSEAEAECAARILAKRVEKPDYLPDQLNPDKWTLPK